MPIFERQCRVVENCRMHWPGIRRGNILQPTGAVLGMSSKNCKNIKFQIQIETSIEDRNILVKQVRDFQNTVWSILHHHKGAYLPLQQQCLPGNLQQKQQQQQTFQYQQQESIPVTTNCLSKFCR